MFIFIFLNDRRPNVGDREVGNWNWILGTRHTVVKVDWGWLQVKATA